MRVPTGLEAITCYKNHTESSTLSSKRPNAINPPQCGAIQLESVLVSSAHRCRPGESTDTFGATIIFSHHAMLFDQSTLHYDPVAELPWVPYSSVSPGVFSVQLNSVNVMKPSQEMPRSQ